MEPVSTRKQEQEARRQERISIYDAQRKRERREAIIGTTKSYAIRYLDIAVISGIVSSMFWFAHGVFT